MSPSRIRFAAQGFCLLALGLAAPLRADPSAPFQQVHCLKYAEGRGPIEMLARGAKPAGEMITLPMLICVAKRPGEVVVLDAGYVDKAFGDSFGAMTMWSDLADRLREVDVEPEAVDLVTISHLHWDHSGGTSRFPKARFVMQRRELEYAVLDLPGNPFVKDGFRIEETIDALRLKWDGRLDLVDGDAEGWQPGVDLYLVPGHTAGTMMVCLDTVQGRVCYSSDAVYLYRNLAENLPLGLAVSPTQMFESYQKIRRVLRGGKLIPGHDIQIFDAAEKHGFRVVSDHVVAIVE